VSLILGKALCKFSTQCERAEGWERVGSRLESGELEGVLISGGGLLVDLEMGDRRARKRHIIGKIKGKKMGRTASNGTVPLRLRQNGWGGR